MWGSWDLSLQVSPGLAKVEVYPSFDHPSSRCKPPDCQIWDLVPRAVTCVAVRLGLGCESWPLPGILELPPLLWSNQGPVQLGPGHYGLWALDKEAH